MRVPGLRRRISAPGLTIRGLERLQCPVRGIAGAAGGRDDSGQSTTGKLRQGLELLLENGNAWNERRAFAAIGVTSSVEFGRGERYPAFTIEGYVAPRFYLVGPLGGDSGNNIDRKRGMINRPGAVLSLGVVDLIVESPTWTFARPGWLPEERLGFRLSIEGDDAVYGDGVRLAQSTTFNAASPPRSPATAPAIKPRSEGSR